MHHLRSNWHILLLAVTVLAVIIVIALYGDTLFAWSREQILALDALSDAHPVLFALALILLYAVLATFFVPCDFVLMPAAGAFFGLGWGLLVASMANALGPTGAFLLSRYVLRRWTVERYGAQIERIDRGMERDGWLYMIVLRIAPILPAPLVNVAAGVTGLKLWQYVTATIVGKIPLTFLYLLAGRELAQIRSLSDVITPQMLGALAALAGFLLVSRLFYARYKAKDEKPHAA